MKRMGRILGALLLGLVAAAGASAQMGQIRGEVRDTEGKPFPEVGVTIKSDDYGTTYEVKTDRKGEFFQSGLRSGIYTLTFKVKGQTYWEEKVRVAAGEEKVVPINFKELLAEQLAAKKKQEEESTKFEDMKVRFEAGRAAMDQAKQVREEIQKTPADQRGPLQEKLGQLYQTAITEYEASYKAAPEKDPNLSVVWANLAQAYEGAGRNEEAAGAYEKAVLLKPTDAGLYLGWGTALARAGKLQEAGAACDKVIPVDKNMGVACWGNIGIVLHQVNKLKEAVEPLRRATELDPNNARNWYLLGASLVAAMDYKTESGKVIPILQPGTVEAYQKCIELDPNGQYGKQAKDGLAQLELLGLGIETKVKSRRR